MSVTDASHPSSPHSRNRTGLIRWLGELARANRLRAEVRNLGGGGTLRRWQVFWTVVVLVGGISGSATRAQQLGPGPSLTVQQPSSAASSPLALQEPPTPKSPADEKPDNNGKPSGGSTIDSSEPKVDAQDNRPQQTDRILWIIPNYRAVSTNAHLPPLGAKGKFWLATQDSFDYSSFIFTGMLAGISMANVSEPSFGQGAAGYGQYYAHTQTAGETRSMFRRSSGRGRRPALATHYYPPRSSTWVKRVSVRVRSLPSTAPGTS